MRIAAFTRSGLREATPFSLADVGMADVAVLATIGSVVGLFLVSPLALESRGIAYLTSGGGILSKFHPSTFIAALALAARCMVSRRPIRKAWRLLTSDPGVLILSAAVGIAAFCALFIDHTPVTPLVDTFMLPALIYVLLRDLDERVVRLLALLLIAVMCLNAVLALCEFLRGFHVFTIAVPDGASADPRRADATFDWRAELALDWRATALLGHPLSNGLMTGCFILCLAAPGSNWLNPLVKLALIGLQGLSLFAFGARTAMVFTLVFACWFGLVQAVEAVARGARIDSRRLGIAILVLCAIVGGGAILLQSGLLDRTVDRFSEDNGSATTRITMFNLFQPLSLADMMLGPDSDLVATWQRLEGLEFGIESSWVGLALTYGLVVTALLVIGLLAFSWSLVTASGRGTVLVLVLFFIPVSVSASMSGKTTIFAMAVSLVLVFLRKNGEEPRRWTPAPAGAVV